MKTGGFARDKRCYSETVLFGLLLLSRRDES